MGARPSSFKSGGGMFHNKDVEIVDYEFLVGDPVEIKKGQRKGEIFTPLSLVPSFLVDGADEPITRRLLIGDASNFGEVSEDGKTLATPDEQSFFANCEAAIFITSLCHPEDGTDGFPEDRLSDDTTEINLEPIIGTRLQLVEVTNQYAKENGKKQKGKNGKEYEIRDLKVGKVYSLPGAKASSGKSAVAGKTTKPAKQEGPTAAEVDEAAAAAITRYASKEAGKTIAVAKLRMKAITDPVFKKDAKLRDLVVENVFEDEDRLAGLDGLEYNAKKKTLKIAA